MRKFFTRIFYFILFFFITAAMVVAQDYAVLLNSGKFVPEQNLNSLNKDQELFRKSLFSDSYYLTLQFTSIPDEKTRMRLSESGIVLIDYIPNLSYTARVKSSIDLNTFKTFPLRSVFRLSGAQKTVPALLRSEFPSYAVRVAGTVDLTIITYEKLSSSAIVSALGNIKATILEEMPQFRSFIIRVDQKFAKDLVDLPFVQWAEFIDPPNKVENLPGRSLHRVNVLNDGIRNLKGDDINIGIWDEGNVSPHLDFLPTGRLTLVENTSDIQHSTHCAGTIGGRGLIDPRARGMAPNAKIFSWNFNGTISSEMTAALTSPGLDVSSHSYGSTVTCGLNGAGVTYSATSRATDINLNNFPGHLHVHSAGNSQTSCSGGWSTITASGKSSKNNILVANITTIEGISGTSSFGPVQDGRVKPEISALGTSVLSTSTPLNSYATLTGTSMATPGVAGSVALLVQRYKQLNGVTPPSTLIKNVILNTAHDLGNPGPDYRFGYGRINALSAVRILEDGRFILSQVANGATNVHGLNVPAGASRLRVMITWNDPAGTANANPALVNNLNLSVTTGATTTLPWILDPVNPGNPATRAVDNVSNIEQVIIDNPDEGAYLFNVTGAAVTTGPDQIYALTWVIESPSIEVTYPNGNESLTPGTVETITWDNTGITGTKTVEFSLDNGGSWTTISSTVPAATTRFAWSVPNANTAFALIRVSSGAVSDVSDANFKILGIPSGLTTSAGTCESGQLSFSWNAVTDATHYDLYLLNTTTGQWEILVANITGTSHTVSGLTPAASLWFTIVAKNNTTGSISEKALAINRIVSSSGLSAIGNITGPVNICGTATGIIYTVPAVTGATTYTWTVPAGATITSGQGTNTIFVTYSSGTGGNITVFASAGPCQTTTATLAVVLGAGVAAPISGGNQNVATCPPNPVPTLTATATVTPGNTVVWYDAPVNGNIVASPILNAVGTVTYYAATRNTASGCESATRTPVTLTITAPPPASIIAGGPLTFCQGGSVILTANAGVAYLWSNGEVGRSITVTTGGSFTVLVDQGSGCSGTSPATIVTVNPLPAAIITANGPTVFCEGGNVTLTASPGSSYSWSNGATTQAITVNNSGGYSVTVTNANGCSNVSASTTVTASAKPVVTLAASPYTRLLPGLTTTISASTTPAGNYNYTWERNGSPVQGANNSSLLVDLEGIGAYTVTATNASGCSNTANISILDSASARLFVYPNPNDGIFQVSYHATGNHTLTIYDSKGAYVYRNVHVLNSFYQRMEVNVRKHGKGVYHIILNDRNGKKVASASVVIQ